MNFHVSKFLFLLAALAACAPKADQPSISGTIRGAEGKTIYLERFANNRGVRSDSTVLDQQGSFVLVPSQPLQKDFYRILLDDSDYLVLITDSTEQVRIEGEAGNLVTGARVEGSEQTAILREFNSGYQELYEELERARAAMSEPAATEEGQARQRQELIDARKALSNYVRQWLESHSSTPAAIAAVQMLDVRTDAEYYRQVVDQLAGSFGKTTHYRLLRQKFRFAAAGGMPEGEEIEDPGAMPQQAVEGIRIGLGKEVPEISLPDPSGKVRKLSDLRGKVVLLDFWASWCGPCRMENPRVVEAYSKYNKEGFDVFSVSLDRDKGPWLDAIAQDGLVWPNHVSDLQFWNSKPAADYGVRSIPFPVLLDREGKVIAYGPNARGPMLEAHLKQIFGH